MLPVLLSVLSLTEAASINRLHRRDGFNFMFQYDSSHCQAIADEAGDPGADIVTKYVDFSVSKLFQQVEADKPEKAFTETEKHIQNDNWFWIDDNAKGLELFSFPGFMDKYATEVNSTEKFITSLSPGPFFFRRYSRPYLEVISSVVNDFSFKTGLLYVHGDLVVGDIYLGFKFHDGRDENVIKLFTGAVYYTYNGVQNKLELNKATANIITEGNKIVLQQNYRALDGENGLLRCIVSTIFEEDSVTPKRTVEILSVSKEVTDVFVNVGFKGIKANQIQVSKTDSHVKHPLEEWDRIQEWKKTKWAVLVENVSWRGFSSAVGTIVNNAEMVNNVVLDPSSKDLTYSYKIGGEGMISEDIIMLAGGLYNTMPLYNPIFENYQKWNKYEISVSYDYGAELHSMSTLFLADISATGSFRFADAWNDEFVIPKFQALVDNFMNPMFTRGAAYAAVGAENFFRATGNPEYARFHEILINALANFDPEVDTLVDNSAAIAWALGRAALLTNNNELAIRAKSFLQNLLTRPVDEQDGNAVYVERGPSYARGVTDNMLWSFKAGVALRSMKVMKKLVKAGLGEFSAGDVERIYTIINYATAYLKRCTTPANEILTCYKCGETNSETQPWGALGLSSPDEIAIKYCPTK